MSFQLRRKASSSLRNLDALLHANLFELHPLEARRLLAVTFSRATGAVLSVAGDLANDTITINKNTAGRLTVNGSAVPWTLGGGTDQVNKISITGSGGNDVVLLTNNVRFADGTGIPSTIAGGNGNDTLTGGPGADLVSGNAGADLLDGGVGSDLLVGGDNFDTTNYSNRTGALRITLNLLADDGEVAIGELDNVQTEEVLGGAGNDTMTGGPGDDFFGGGGGNDSLRGGPGNDENIGLAGNDALLGEAGNDYNGANDGVRDTVNGGTNPDLSPDQDIASVDGTDVGGREAAARAAAAAAAAARVAELGDAPGDLDESYGPAGDGRSLGDDLGWEFVGAAAVDSEGRAVFAGYKQVAHEFGTDYDFVVARFTADGEFDTSFASDGEAEIDFTPVGSGYGYNDDDFARGIAFDENGGIVVVGYTDQEIGGRRMAIARLDGDGNLLGSFGGSGRVTVAFAGGEAIATAAVVDDQDRVIAVGRYNIGESSDQVAVARLNPNGALDVNFNDGGRVLSSFDEGSSAATSVALWTPGESAPRIVIGGTSSGDFGLMRLLSNGNPDPSFSGDGVTTRSFSDFNTLRDIAVTGDGDIIAVGDTSFEGEFLRTPDPDVNETEAVVAKFDFNGEFVAAHGESNLTAESFQYLSYGSVEIDEENGKIVVAGDDDSDFVVSRYNLDDLSLDADFSDGYVSVDLGDTFDVALAVGLTADGKIVAAGWSSFGEGGSVFSAVRLSGGGGAEDEDVVTETEVVPFNPLRDEPLDEPLATQFADNSSTSLFYARAQADADGVVRLVLDDRANDVRIYNVVAGDGKVNTAVNVDGVVLYYDPDTTARIEIHARGGNDAVRGNNDVVIPLLIDGGTGNDLILAGGGNDIIFAGAGQDIAYGAAGNDAILGGGAYDVLLGDGGRDLVIGGANTDALAGGGDEDIVIGGTTAYDDNTAANVAALDAIMAEWGSAGSNAVRIANVRNGGGLNGASVLRAGAGGTVFNDNASDVVTNDAGRDWFFIRTAGSAFQRDSVLFGTAGQEVDLV